MSAGCCTWRASGSSASPAASPTRASLPPPQAVRGTLHRPSRGPTYGYNTSHRGLAIIGDFQSGEPTLQSLEGAARLVAHGYQSGEARARALAGTHTEYGRKQSRGTSCPGARLIRPVSTIDRRAAEIIAADGDNSNLLHQRGSGTSDGSGALVYTVRAGETLWGIGQQHAASVAQLTVWNELDDAVAHPPWPASVCDTAWERAGNRPGALPGADTCTVACAVLHGTGHTARCRSLGISGALYERVRAEVNRRA